MKNKKAMPVGRQGFTLIELLVVIAIIGLLSTLAVVSLNGARSKARDARRTSDLKAIQSAVELYKGENSSDAIFTMPAEGVEAWESLGTLAVDPGPYLVNYLPGGMPVDPTNDATYKYTFCTNPTAGVMNYLITATLENSATTNGSIGLISTWANANCLNSINGAGSVAAGTCGTANLFCLGDISR